MISNLITFLLLVTSVHTAILRRGNPLSFNKAKQYLNSVRRSGVLQFANHYHRVKDVKTPTFLWGDELEYGIFEYKQELKSYDIAICRGVDIQTNLEQLEKKLASLPYGCLWQPEYGSWMVEAVPREPYDGFASTLLRVEKSMQLRRKRLHAALRMNEIAPTMTAFPILGVPGLDHTTNSINNNPACCSPEGKLMEAALQHNNSISMSSYIRDNVINPHPRFGTLTKNIRMRRGKKVNINIPIESPSTTSSLDMIHMDAMAFGMGCCCLQITMQSATERESRYLHDQLTILSPLFLALSAATPILKGQLAGTDTRWDTILQAVDDRTAAEAGEAKLPFGSSIPDPELAGGGIKRLSKSRYSSVSRYIGKPCDGAEARDLEKLNDMDADIDEDLYKLIKSRGNIDDSLSKHLAHLFVRDPLVIFDDAIYLDDQKSLDHFENIQSTNWRTIRWKTPALEVGLEAQRRNYDKNPWMRFALRKTIPLFTDVDNDNLSHEKSIESYGPGWRVEFRPLEIQLTDFENAAYAMIIVLISRAMLAMGYNFYLPISYVEENMRRAQLMDAAIEQKFYIRRQSFDNRHHMSGDDMTSKQCRLVPKDDVMDIIEVSIDEIFNGSPSYNDDDSKNYHMKGLIPAVVDYLRSLNTNDMTINSIHKYLSLLSKRASGELPTAARWMRSYVKQHPSYDGSGHVSCTVVSDMMKLCDDIGMGRVHCPELLGDVYVDRLYVDECSETYLDTSSPSINNDIHVDDRMMSIYNDKSSSEKISPSVVSSECSDGVNEFLLSHPIGVSSYLG